jgi:DNA-binding beta-propeller fold protein YncE
VHLKRKKPLCVALLSAALLAIGVCSAQEMKFKENVGSAAKLVRSIDLPGYTGDFDHFTADRATNRLFLAAEDHATLEIFDLRDGSHKRTVPGFGIPHSVSVLPDGKRLLVADGGAETQSEILDLATLRKTGSLKLLPGADSIFRDPDEPTLYMVTGGKDVHLPYSILYAVDANTLKVKGQLKIEATHVEAMALEAGTARLFINLTDKAEVAVIDRRAMKEITRWKLGSAAENSPMAFDQDAHRLFVVCRKPASLLILDSDSGAVLATLPAPGHSDDAAYDQAKHRLYVPGAEGWLGVYQIKDGNATQIARIETAAGAKTEFLDSEGHKLFLAVSPGDSKASAKLLIYDLAP